jgi:hypothetical protein
MWYLHAFSSCLSPHEALVGIFSSGFSNFFFLSTPWRWHTCSTLVVTYLRMFCQLGLGIFLARPFSSCCGSCPYWPHVWPSYPIQFTPCSSSLGDFIGTTYWNCLLLGSPLRVFSCMDILDLASLREGCWVAGGAEGDSLLG